VVISDECRVGFTEDFGENFLCAQRSTGTVGLL